MIIDFLISKDGLRVDNVEASVSGIRFTRSGSGLAPHSAASVTGSLRLTLADLTAAFARPEILDQLISGVSGVARPEISFTDAADGGIRITGTIEILGRRLPVSAFSRLTIENDRVVVSATQLEGLPMLGMLSAKLPALALPLTLPPGLHFSDVVTEKGAIVIGFAGQDVALAPLQRPAVAPELDSPDDPQG